jgi:hypothetical protein
MVSSAAWFAEIERRGAEFLVARAAMHREVGERIRRELAPSGKVAVRPIVIEGPEDVEVDEAGGGRRVPAAATRIRLAAVGVGWVPRVVRAVAAVPGKGIVESWSVRCRRHDERLAAVWVGGAFDCAFYVRPDVGLERLGFRTTKTRRGVVDAINGVRLPSA